MKPPILIIDDEKDNLDALSRLLRTDFDVMTSLSPFEGLKLVQKNEFHVIISDQRMPEMTGVDFFEKIKHQKPLTVRILLTGYTDIDSVIAAINRGHVYRYIAKPWDPEELKTILRQAAEHFQLRAELEKKNQALEKALEQLKGLDVAKGRFLRLVSHELNTPLTVLASFTELIAQNAKQIPADLNKAVSGLQNSVSRFQNIIEEILAFIQLDAKSTVTVGEITDFSTLASQAIASLKGAFGKKQITCKAEITPGLQAKGNPSHLSLGIRKLLEDSVKRAPMGSEISVHVGSSKGSVTAEVIRQGEALPKQPFALMESSSNELLHGSNLGLALPLTKLVADTYGGEISVQSNAKQTTIRWSLPQSPS